MFETWPNDHMVIQDPLLNYFIFALICFYPLYRVAKRAGLPFWTACTIFVPYIGMVIVAGLFAHKKWKIKKLVVVKPAPKKTPKKKVVKKAQTKKKAGKK